MQRTLIVVCFYMAVILGSVFLASLFFVGFQSSRVLPISSTHQFIVSEGEDIHSVSSRLLSAKIIEYKMLFEAVFVINSKEESIRSGEYTVKPHTTYRQLVNMLHHESTHE